MIGYTLAFGHKVPPTPPVEDGLQSLLAEARAAARRAADTPIEKTLEVLDRASRRWADPADPLRRKALEELPDRIGFSRAMVEEGLATVAAICSRASLERRLLGELGGKHFRQTWQARPGLDHDVLAVPRGVVVHLAAGNVFVGAVDSLVAGIVTGNANLLKMSRVDPLFPILFLESLRECDPEGYVWPNQAAFLWRGGDLAVEGPLLSADLTVVFWGGQEALAAVRSRLGPATRLIENGPRYSFAAAEGEYLEQALDAPLLRGLALDLCRWDQQACSSPQMVYVIGGRPGLVHTLMDRLAPVLDDLERTLPLGRLSFDEKVEIRRVRELAMMAEAKGQGRLVAPAPFIYTLIASNDPAFRISCLNRTLFFAQVPSLEALLEQAAPVASYLQTVGLVVAPTHRAEWERRLLEIGVKRLTEWGGMSQGSDGAPHEGAYLLGQLVNWVSREHLPEKRLTKLLREIRAAPYYARLLADLPGETPDFTAIPLLDRATFYAHCPPKSHDILTGPMRDAYVYTSGGTTGDPKVTLYSNREYRTATDVLAFIYRTAGLTPDDVVGNLFIAGFLWTSFNVAGRALENIGCLNLPIGGATEFAQTIKYLEMFEATGVVGLPSIIVKLAEEVRARGSPLRIRKILYGGEHMRPQTAEFLKQTLGAEWVRSAGYACVDTGPIGFQCPHLTGAVHHVLEDYQFVEILHPVDQRPCSVGTVGEIVATNLDRVLMPVVRYRTGDLGRWVSMAECPCGFRGRTFELLGRCDDQLVIGGINLLPPDVAAGLALLPGVSPNFQVVARTQDRHDLLVVRLEAEHPLPDATVIEALKKGSYKIAEALTKRWLVIEIEWFKPGGIPRNPRTGKLKTIIEERS
ncbi:MAG: Phenylacetate-coenzyme A ligase [Candidatus Ozemobacter sibiricus]|jgi:phenylacetate-coenzyme A ligase PaaK-like adenylate-forming protein|uniref:long-chain-fatty-acyl-CoA reductase n=1 Tax=Candidatus Ozemobacter sibiricus TaxID=2268124 RepID=A0A367ZND5_9BACT|nr:MAG: Phenylacetate-coenzyme A ligase [Candidatus Ozemobacter sibiricus]